MLAQCLITSFDQNMSSLYSSWATTNPSHGSGTNGTHYKVFFVISVEATLNVHFVYLNWLYLQDNQILLYKEAFGKVWFSNQTITLSGFLCTHTKIIFFKFYWTKQIIHDRHHKFKVFQFLPNWPTDLSNLLWTNERSGCWLETREEVKGSKELTGRRFDFDDLFLSEKMKTFKLKVMFQLKTLIYCWILRNDTTKLKIECNILQGIQQYEMLSPWPCRAYC